MVSEVEDLVEVVEDTTVEQPSRVSQYFEDNNIAYYFHGYRLGGGREKCKLVHHVRLSGQDALFLCIKFSNITVRRISSL
jgi:hypothetical protein